MIRVPLWAKCRAEQTQGGPWSMSGTIRAFLSQLLPHQLWWEPAYVGLGDHGRTGHFRILDWTNCVWKFNKISLWFKRQDMFMQHTSWSCKVNEDTNCGRIENKKVKNKQKKPKDGNGSYSYMWAKRTKCPLNVSLTPCVAEVQAPWYFSVTAILLSLGQTYFSQHLQCANNYLQLCILLHCHQSSQEQMPSSFFVF